MEIQNPGNDKVMCPHCKNYGSGKICPQCGENLHPQRITLARMIRDIPDVFFDLEFGLLYTFRTFLTRPGREIKEYFAGDRQKHYKPLKFILFVGGIVTLLIVKADVNDGRPTTALQEFERQWNSAILILQFPFIALATWLIWKKRKYNYGEHLVANAFLIAEVITYHIVFFPIYLLVNHTVGIDIVSILYYFWVLGYYSYAFYDWFYDRKTAAAFFKCLGVTFAIFIATMIISIPLEVLLYFIVSRLGLT